MNVYKNRSKKEFIISQPLKIEADSDEKAMAIALQTCTEMNLVSNASYFECKNLCSFEKMKIYNEDINTEKYIQLVHEM